MFTEEPDSGDLEPEAEAAAAAWNAAGLRPGQTNVLVGPSRRNAAAAAAAAADEVPESPEVAAADETAASGGADGDGGLETAVDVAALRDPEDEEMAEPPDVGDGIGGADGEPEGGLDAELAAALKLVRAHEISAALTLCLKRVGAFKL